MAEAIGFSLFQSNHHVSQNWVNMPSENIANPIISPSLILIVCYLDSRFTLPCGYYLLRTFVHIFSAGYSSNPPSARIAGLSRIGVHSITIAVAVLIHHAITASFFVTHQLTSSILHTHLPPNSSRICIIVQPHILFFSCFIQQIQVNSCQSA